MPRKKKRSAFREIVGFPVRVGRAIEGLGERLHTTALALAQKKEPVKRKRIGAKYSALTLLSEQEGSFKEWMKKMESSESTIGIILGARGTGKTAFGIRLLENIHARYRRPCVALGFEESALPYFITPVATPKDIPNNSLVLIDEGGILFNSRRSMSNANKLLSQLLLIARHKDLSILFISQNSSNLEVNILRQADFLVLKPSSLMQKDFERKMIQKIYSSIATEFKTLSEARGATYIYADTFRGFVSNTLPSFWSEGLSKGFSGK